MELLCNAPAHASVPDRYVFPPEKRAALQLDGVDGPDDGVTLPVVDLHRAALSGDDGLRRRVAEEIVRAGKEFGFFQVVNHGVGEDVVRGFRDAAAEFFAMPVEEKMPYCSDDQSKPFRLASSTSYDKSETRYWRDYLKLQCHPVSDELVRHWPMEPTSFRPRLAEFSEAAHELAQTLLSLVAEGLGLRADFFAGDLSGGETQMNVNYYPPCPDPSLTLGLLPHCDRHLLTVLSQGDVAGLQARYNGRWLLVRPVPGAFVINFGHQMEIVTNGALASVEHRAITNSAVARMSVATLIMPKMECRIGPAPEMVDDETNPAKFREFVFSEFMEAYNTAAASREDVLDSFRIHRD
ncbi:hypothetical protein QYE76_019501 [Lolium multiflorum]|uniref:Fe2OG dioxygenase domain-containing protein n=1 Tax=Lolium multiflorum TaxID=4521 RepID=A0AAD8VP58_LOLMU|nr:hypothetical protein QYE76_019501 [Lolium multiflorum]